MNKLIIFFKLTKNFSLAPTSTPFLSPISFKPIFSARLTSKPIANAIISKPIGSVDFLLDPKIKLNLWFLSCNISLIE